MSIFMLILGGLLSRKAWRESQQWLSWTTSVLSTVVAVFLGLATYLWGVEREEDGSRASQCRLARAELEASVKALQETHDLWQLQLQHRNDPDKLVTPTSRVSVVAVEAAIRSGLFDEHVVQHLLTVINAVREYEDYLVPMRRYWIDRPIEGTVAYELWLSNLSGMVLNTGSNVYVLSGNAIKALGECPES